MEKNYIDHDKLIRELDRSLMRIEPLYREFYTKKEAIGMWRDTLNKETTEGLQFIENVIRDCCSYIYSVKIEIDLKRNLGKRKMNKYQKTLANRQLLKNLRKRILSCRKEIKLPREHNIPIPLDPYDEFFFKYGYFNDDL